MGSSIAMPRLRGIAFVVAALIAGSTPACALTRAPASGTGESSLLYWRYLCRGQPQEQIQIKNKRELSCPSQRWRVNTRVGEDRVIEVIEDAS